MISSMSYDMQVFEKGLIELDIDLTDQQIDQFIHYYELFIEWNKVMNLTAITEFDDVIKKHFLDSLSLVRVLRFENHGFSIESEKHGFGSQQWNCNTHTYQTVLDLGSGAGFPGIPLKIAFPEIKIVLMDSLNKRVRFLNHVIESLGLKNSLAVHGRAEEMARKKEYRQQFDLCVSRAVSNLSTLAEYCLPFVRVNGSFVSYKSADADQEIDQAARAIRLLGGKIVTREKFVLPGSDLGRTLVCINKIKDTPKAYPRKTGTPTKDPL